jgi:fatty acid desaturase (delta-4 desaturase)
MSKHVDKYRTFEAFLSFLFMIRWVALPLYQVPSLYTLLHILPMAVVGGYYLAFFFIISHNYVGVHMFNNDAGSHKYDSFLYRQVTSSSNVGGAWLCFINGGLNYQIEHHLFPRIQHNHYPLIAPIVRQFCLDKNIPYVHFPTVWDNMNSCIQHLYDMGHTSNKNKIEE